MPERSNKIYSATYSNVPVYEYNVAGNHIMRRRSDDWINATHILKVADHDKPARTRILEREVQKGVHEKVQGGYGKYQGTWIPLAEGRTLAERNGVLEKLLPILDFVPGDRSPPPAPKHATATSNKPKVPKQPGTARRAPAKTNAAPQRSQMSDMSYDAYSAQATPDRASMASESDIDMLRHSSQYTNQSQNRKRKRHFEEPETMSYEDQQHLLWTDELLDYFMLQNSNDPLPAPPEPPQSIDLNRAVDDKGHTPMHWAAAMGDLNVVRDLLQRGARIDSAAANGETPLMRAVLFTNNFDKQIMDRLIQVLQSTVHQKDWCLSTVFHHIVATTCSKSKYQCARYYLDTILERIGGSFAPQQIANLLDQQDQNGDTAILIAARYGARKCVRSLLGCGASITIPNNRGQTADELIQQLNARRRERYGLQNLNVTSSSPVRGSDVNGTGFSYLNAGNDHNQNSISLTHGNTLNNNSNILPSSATATPRSLRHLSNPAAKRLKTTIYHSEAAQLLTSQLPVLITSRTEALAAALEAELHERDVEIGEGERVLATRRRDLAELKARREALAKDAQALEDNDNSEEAAAQRRELEALEADARRHAEQTQAREIVRLVTEVAPLDPAADDSGIGMLANGSPTKDDGDSQERLRLARAVAEQQTRHAQLLDEVVAAQASASAAAASEGHDASDEATQGRANQALYKRLITAALGVPPEDVEGLLPDMLRELEDARRDRAAVFADGGVDGDVNMLDAPSGSVSAAALARHGGAGAGYGLGGGAREAVRAAG